MALMEHLSAACAPAADAPAACLLVMPSILRSMSAEHSLNMVMDMYKEAHKKDNAYMQLCTLELMQPLLRE